MDIAISLTVLVAIALVLGAVALFRQGGNGKRAVLMLVLAAVMAMNIAIWAWPDDNGRSLVSEAQKEKAPE